MKLNVSVVVIVVVVVLTLVAAAFRVSTATERRRMRLDAAKSSCLGAGGAWVVVDNEEACQPARVPAKL